MKRAAGVRTVPRMKRPLVLALAVLAVTATLPAAPAAAGFPGKNARIAFQRWVSPSTAPDVYTVQPSGAGTTNLTSSGATEDTRPAWSADGARLALRRMGPGVSGLWVMNADGTGLAAVPGTDLDRAPTWSPDNDRLVYECYAVPGAAPDVCVREVDGGGFVQLTATAGVEETGPVWSPDGGRVVFSRENAAGTHLVSLDLDTMTEDDITAPLAGRFDYVPDWSPDGTNVAFARFVTGTGYGAGIYRMSAGGGKTALVTKPARMDDTHHTMPAWSPDGTKIAYVRLDDDEAFGHVFTVGANGSGNTQVTFGKGVTDEWPDWRAG